jgi:peptidoglycan/xylan/chitin deacetylase (PgdA/CDA1 family)
MAAVPARPTSPTPAPTLAPTPTPVPTSILAHPEPSRRTAVIKPMPGSEYFTGDANRSDIYITIDDCQTWSRVDTDLETAKAKGVQLTLFPAGKYIDTAEADAERVLQKAVAYGDEIDNHTYSHANIVGPTSVAGLKADLDRQIQVVRTALKDPTYQEWFVRTPYGSGMDNPNLVNAAAKDGLAIVKLSLDSSGYVANSTVGYVMKNVFESRNFKGGAIILLHDDYTDMKALPLIIDTIRARGFTVGGPLRNILIDPATTAFRDSRDQAAVATGPEIVMAREDYPPAA